MRLQKRTQQKNQKGFTLVEVLMTIAIMTTMMGLVAVSVSQPQTTADLESAVNQLITDIKSQQLLAMSGETNGSGSRQDQGVTFQEHGYTLFSSGSTCEPTGDAYYERYDGISGTAITDLYNDPDFPSNPNATQIMSGADLSSPINIADNFGGRLSALICPPETGTYTFYVTGDDETQLRLSTSTNPAAVSVIASVPGWAPVDNWTTYSQQTSSPVNLTAGQYYYIEANYKEGGGGDHAQIGWQLPDTTLERPIPNTRYSMPSETDAVTDVGSGSFSINLKDTISITTSLPDSRLVFQKGSGDVVGLTTGTATITVTNEASGDTSILTINNYGSITVTEL